MEVEPDVMANGTGNVILNGDDNEIIIGQGCVLINAIFRLGSECQVRIGRTSRLAQIDVFAERQGTVIIGDNTNFTAQARLYLHEPGRIVIGDNCMIASQTFFTVSDMHSLIDMDSGQRINPASDITIGDKVWIGAEAAVMKGVTIGDGSAVGFRAVVTANIPPHCLAVGAPARVVRERITWSPALI